MAVRKNRQNRIAGYLCGCLALLLLLGSLAACATNEPQTPGKQTETESETAATVTTGPIGTESGVDTDEPVDVFDPESAPTPYMEDFGEYEFRVLSRNANETYWAGNDICGDASGNALDKAVFTRNELVGQKYNFYVFEFQSEDWIATAQATGMTGGKDAYDMWAFKMNDMPSLAQEGYMWDLRDVEYIRLNAAYYDQSLRKSASFANHEFFLTGDLVYMDELATECIVFNPDMWNSFNMELTFGKTPYEIVDDGEWTIEKFTEMVKITTFDRDGNDVMDRTDWWGFCWENSNILGLNIGMGNELLTKDEDDIFILDVKEKQITDLEKIIELFNAGYSVGRDWTEDVFDMGNQFCTIRGIKYLADYTALGLNFGVLPFFKSSVEQKNYYAFISTYGSNAVNITTTAQDPNKVASIIELLSYQSRKTVSPTFNNYIFGGRILQHEEDTRMLELVFANRRYELCYLWSTGSLYSTMITLNDAQATGIASTIASCKGAVEASVARKLERLQNLA